MSGECLELLKKWKWPLTGALTVKKINYRISQRCANTDYLCSFAIAIIVTVVLLIIMNPMLKP